MTVYEGVFHGSGAQAEATAAEVVSTAPGNLPRKAFLWPIFYSGNLAIRVNTGSANTVAVTLDPNTAYFLSGDGSSTDLLQVIEDALNLNTDGSIATVSMDYATHIITIAWDVSASILWADALTTFGSIVLGWTDANLGSSTSHVAPNQTKGVWLPEQEHADDVERPALIGQTVVTTSTGRGSHGGTTYTRQIFYHMIPETRLLTESVATTKPYGALEFSWVDGRMGSGTTIRVYDDTLLRGTTDYKGYVSPSRAFPIAPMDMMKPDLYEVSFDLFRVEVPA